MKKKGISAIVATVLVILITVAGVGIIWVGIVPMISENIAFESLEGRVSIVSTGGYTVYDADREIAMVQVKRDVDDGVMDRIVVSFIIDGNSVSSNVVAPGSGQTKTYSFDLSGYGEPDSVGVAPIFVSGNSEKVGSETSSVKISSGTMSSVDGVVYEMGVDSFSDVPTDGLVSIWTFSGDADDGWGDIDGDLVGGADVVGGELVLDGVDDWLEISPVSNLNIPNDITISFWVDVGSGLVISLGAQYGVFIWGSGGSKSVVYWYWGQNSNAWRTFQTSDGTVPSSGWSHIVLTNIPGNGNPLPKVYVNGVEQTVTGPAQENNAGSSNRFRIGEYAGYTPYRPTEGNIDDVMIFDRVLDSQEVEIIYESQRKS